MSQVQRIRALVKMGFASGLKFQRVIELIDQGGDDRLVREVVKEIFVLDRDEVNDQVQTAIAAVQPIVEKGIGKNIDKDGKDDADRAFLAYLDILGAD